MKNINLLLLRFYQLITGLVYFCAYPFLWLFLKTKKYTEVLSAHSEPADILIHLASLGEINALSGLLRCLLADGHTIGINTVTNSGKARAKELFPDLQVRLAPLDLAHLKARQYRQMQPKLILIAETEIWPNLLYMANKANIPVLFINARISEKSLQSFLPIKGMLHEISHSVKGIFTQSEADRQRFAQLFAAPVHTVGNLKYALELPAVDSDRQKEKLGYDKKDFILVWGSSRPGEEALLLNTLPLLQAQIPSLKLIIAPRHPKRINEVQELLNGYKYQLYSEYKAGTAADILLIDVLGVLYTFYAIADIAIVGGSFGNFGGHNPLEPAFYEKAIIMGADYASCRDSVKSLQQQSAIIISTAESLAPDVFTLFKNPALRREMGERAKKVLTQNATALTRHLQEIEKWL